MNKLYRFITKRNVLLVLAALSFLIAWNRGLNLLYGMFALLLAIFLIAMLLPFFSLKGLSGRRTTSSAAFEDEELEISVEVRNGGLIARHMVEVLDNIPAAEPGSEKAMTFLARLKGGKSREYNYRLSCYKRGEHTLGPLRLQSSYPLGIMTSTAEMEGSTVGLTVYPRIQDLVRFPVLDGSAVPSSESESMAKVGGSDEFFGIREYRQGDGLKYVHWPSSARQNKLIVKEFEVRGTTDVTACLDLKAGSDIGYGRETTLEYAVKTVGSIAKYVLWRGHSFQLVGRGKAEHVVPTGQGRGHFARVLEELARVKANGPLTFAATINRYCHLLKEGSTAVLVFSQTEGEMDSLQQALALLKAKRITVVCVLMDVKSFKGKGGGEDDIRGSETFQNLLAGRGYHLYRVSCGDDIGNIFL